MAWNSSLYPDNNNLTSSGTQPVFDRNAAGIVDLFAGCPFRYSSVGSKKLTELAAIDVASVTYYGCADAPEFDVDEG